VRIPLSVIVLYYNVTNNTLLSTVVAQHNSTLHTLWGCAVELASALAAAIILSLPTVSEMT